MTSYGSQPGGTPPGDQSNMPPPGGYAPPPGQQQPDPGMQPTQYPPPQGYTPPPATPAPAPPRKRSPLLIILAIVVGVIVLCGVATVLGVGGILGGVLAATQPVANAGDAYMTALRDGDYNKAFDLSAPSLQQEAGNAAGLEAALSFKQPATWGFTSRNINNNDGSLSGTTTYKDGSTGTVDMALTKVGNDWKVTGIQLK